jgi:hypothetical protein
LAPVKKKRKTKNEMLQGITLELAATERNVMSIQKQFSQSIASDCSEIVHSTNDPSKSVPLSTESSGIEYESSMIEQTFQFTEEISESNEDDDEQEFLLQPVNRELLPVDLRYMMMH